MGQVEWVHLTTEQLAADPGLGTAVARFRAPSMPAGDAAAEWLQTNALGQADHVATYVALEDREIGAFYSLAMGEVELSSSHQGKLGVSHPRQGAVLIVWLARAAEAAIGAEMILRHAVGIAQIGAQNVGAAVIALDPFDAATEEY